MLSKVVILPGAQGESPFVIGDNALPRGPGSKMIIGGLPSFDAAVQVNQYLDADQIENIDRLNEITNWPVEVAYEFATFEESRVFARNLQKRVPRVATVQFNYDNAVFFIVGAKLRPITAVQDQGCTIVYQFNISGGLIVDTLPVSEAS